MPNSGWNVAGRGDEVSDESNKGGLSDEQKNEVSEAKRSQAEECTAATKSTLPVNMFLGSFSHALDAKGRIIVPVAYRKGLGEQFVVAPSLDFSFIAIYPYDVWEMEIAKLYRKAQKNVSIAGTFLERFSEYSYPNLELDSQGRILLPQRIRQRYLGDAKEVVVAGKMNHVLVKSQQKVDIQDKEFELNKDEWLKQLDLIEE